MKFVIKKLTICYIFTIFSSILLLISCKSNIDENYPIIKGETIALTGFEEKTLLYEAIKILDVYSYAENGEKIVYKKTDYNFSNNCIKRTKKSKIPDFYNYLESVKFNEDGTFLVEYNSSFRNPKQTINYQVFVDYVANVEPKTIIGVKEEKQNLNVLIVGDSIGAGADTISRTYYNNLNDCFSNYLDIYLTAQGISHTVTNCCVDGAKIENLIDKLDSYIDDKAYDVVIIEFGMNDHMRVKNGEAAFKEGLSLACSKFMTHGIKVILIGFFQQNELWFWENPTYTKSYNNIIKECAKLYSIPFIDIYSEFNNIGENFINDMTADWLHHPNSFGHKIYFSALVPYFTFTDILTSDIENYVLY